MCLRSRIRCFFAFLVVVTLGLLLRSSVWSLTYELVGSIPADDAAETSSRPSSQLEDNFDSNTADDDISVHVGLEPEDAVQGSAQDSSLPKTVWFPLSVGESAHAKAMVQGLPPWLPGHQEEWPPDRYTDDITSIYFVASPKLVLLHGAFNDGKKIRMWGTPMMRCDQIATAMDWIGRTQMGGRMLSRCIDLRTYWKLLGRKWKDFISPNSIIFHIKYNHECKARTDPRLRSAIQLWDAVDLFLMTSNRTARGLVVNHTGTYEGVIAQSEAMEKDLREDGAPLVATIPHHHSNFLHRPYTVRPAVKIIALCGANPFLHGTASVVESLKARYKGLQVNHLHEFRCDPLGWNNTRSGKAVVTADCYVQRMQEADVLVVWQTSDWRMLRYKSAQRFVNALASGVPTVTLKSMDAVREASEAAPSLHVPLAENVPELLDWLVRLIESRELRNSVSKDGVEMAKAFEITRIAQLYLDMINEARERRRKGYAGLPDADVLRKWQHVAIFHSIQK